MVNDTLKRALPHEIILATHVTLHQKKSAIAYGSKLHCVISLGHAHSTFHNAIVELFFSLIIVVVELQS